MIQKFQKVYLKGFVDHCNCNRNVCDANSENNHKIQATEKFKHRKKYLANNLKVSASIK